MISVFDFTDFKEYLKYRIENEMYTPSGRRKFNLAQLTTSLGYSSPSLLSMVLKGKRLPSKELCDVLVENWKLSYREQEYFRLLVQLEKKKNQGQDTSKIIDSISKISGGRSAYSIKSDEFKIIRHWYYLVIKQLVSTPDFKEDPQWISKQLRRRISPTTAQEALTKLEQMGYLVRDPETRILKVVHTQTETTHEIPSAAIQDHHQQMLEAAKAALAERPVEERFFNSLSFNLDPERIPEIKQMFLELMRKVDSDFSSTKSNSVFQVNLQFFEHTNTAFTKKEKI